MFFFLVLWELALSNQSEVTVLVEHSGQPKETLVLAGPDSLIQYVLQQLSNEYKYSTKIEQATFTLVGPQHSVKLNRIPDQFMEVKGYVSSAFGDASIYYTDESGSLFMVVDQTTYETAVFDMGHSPTFLVLTSVEAFVPAELSIEEYYAIHSADIVDLIKHFYEIVLNEPDFGIRAIQLPLLSVDDAQFPHLIKVLPYMDTLTSIDFMGNFLPVKVAQDFARSLNHLPELTSISLNICGLNWLHFRDFAEVLSPLPSVRTLELQTSELDIVAARYLRQVLDNLQNLTTLDLGYSFLDAESIAEFKGFQGLPLEVLVLSGNSITSVGLSSLLENDTPHTLKELHLAETELQDDPSVLVSVLPRFSGLEVLSLAKNHLGDEGMQFVVQVLPQLPLLRNLDLSSNELTEISIGLLSPHTRTLTHLETLNLSGNNLSPMDEHILHKETYPHYTFAVHL